MGHVICYLAAAESLPPRTSTGARAFGTLYGEYNDLYDVYDGDDHEEDEEDDGYTGKGQIQCWACGGESTRATSA